MQLGFNHVTVGAKVSNLKYRATQDDKWHIYNFRAIVSRDKGQYESFWCQHFSPHPIPLGEDDFIMAHGRIQTNKGKDGQYRTTVLISSLTVVSVSASIPPPVPVESKSDLDSLPPLPPPPSDYEF